MKLIKIITKENEYIFGKDDIELQNGLKTKTHTNVTSYLINNNYVVISSDKIVFECDICKKEVIKTYSNFKNRKHDLCISCTRKKTVTEVHKNMSEEKRIKLNNKISKTTKIAMNKISPEKRLQMTEKMLKSMDWDIRNKHWLETMSNKSNEEKKETGNKISKSLNKRTKEEKTNTRSKVKKTWLKKYGVEHISQNEQILEKQMLARNDSWKLKYYNSKFGKLNYQTIPELKFIKYCENSNIFIKNGPRINYIFNNNKLKYTTDFETNNYIIEIKSSHIWYYQDLESGKINAKNKAAQKHAASINKKFLFLLDIKDYSKFIQ